MASDIQSNGDGGGIVDQAADEVSSAFAAVQINVLEMRGGEQLDNRLTEFLGLGGVGVEFLVNARPLPRGRVRHGEHRRRLDGNVEREMLAIIEF